MTRILSKITGIAILGLCLFMLNAGLQPATSHAACSNPAGVAADIVYNSSAKIFQYCDNTNWIRMNQVAGSGSGSCNLGGAGTVPEGTLFYNQDYRVLSGCAGSTNSTVGPVGGVLGWSQLSTFGGGLGLSFCGIRSDDRLYCWGTNTSGFVGDNTTTARSVPTAVFGGELWRQVDNGNSSTCGITDSGSLKCWGFNNAGRTGLNTAAGNTLAPAEVVGGGNWKSVSLGNIVGCAIKSDDSLWCWGSNAGGKTGLNTSSGSTLIPTGINGGGLWKQVSAGNHACAVKQDYTLWCWGSNANGRTGLNTSTGNTLVPTRVNLDTWKSVSASEGSTTAHTCAIKSDDSLWCWGSNANGKTGLNTDIGDTLVPVQVNGGSWDSVSAGPNHTCAIDNLGVLHCWGANDSAQLASGVLGGDVLVPTAIAEGGEWTKVEAGTKHTCALSKKGVFNCWGDNGDSRFGDGKSITVMVPKEVTVAGSTNGVGMGTFHSCAINESQELHCWGNNGNGRTGLNTILGFTSLPEEVSGGGNWKKIAAGLTHTCGIKTDDTLWCWGQNDSGRTGLNIAGPSNTLVPTQISGGGAWKDVTIGFQGSCGIKSDDTVWCWGFNANGSLGTGTSGVTYLVPNQVSGGGNWISVSLGDYHSCGIKSDDTLWCWGSNNYGRTGLNTATGDTLVPTPVSGGGTWKSVSADESHTCGIKQNNTLWCWGNNANGRTGLNLIAGNTLVPTEVSGGGTWDRVQTGLNSTCAVSQVSSMYCWGENSSTGLGLTSGDTLVPTSLSGAYGGWRDLSAGKAGYCAVNMSAQLWCWGANSDLQLTSEHTNPYQLEAIQTICVEPDGKAGEIIFNSSNNVLQYCDGVSWVGIGK
jgi:alpha-tubulin suppressor-like RCC1 family protein